MINFRSAGIVGLLVSFLISCFCSCSSPAKRVSIHTEPVGAAVSSVDGVAIGATPLMIVGENLQRLSKDNRLMVLIEAPGYIPRQLIFDIHGEDVYTVNLSKYDPNYFSERLLKDFHKNANEMSRELLRIQGLLMVRKLDEAERSIDVFQKAYPSIAASYALAANVEMLRGQPEKARAYLLAGEALDNEDPAIKRALGMQVKPAKAGAKK